MATTLSSPSEMTVAPPQEKVRDRYALGRLPWYKGVSTNVLNKIWTPWSLLPWLVLITGLIMLWCKAKRADPFLRLFSLRPVNA